MGVRYRKLKKKGRKMKRFILDLLFPTKQRKLSLVWHHINNVASKGVIGRSATDRKKVIRGHDGY